MSMAKFCLIASHGYLALVLSYTRSPELGRESVSTHAWAQVLTPDRCARIESQTVSSQSFPEVSGAFGRVIGGFSLASHGQLPETLPFSMRDSTVSSDSSIAIGTTKFQSR